MRIKVADWPKEKDDLSHRICASGKGSLRLKMRWLSSSGAQVRRASYGVHVKSKPVMARANHRVAKNLSWRS